LLHLSVSARFAALQRGIFAALQRGIFPAQPLGVFAAVPLGVRSRYAAPIGGPKVRIEIAWAISMPPHANAGGGAAGNYGGDAGAA
jgi:hypothetical protein